MLRISMLLIGGAVVTTGAIVAGAGLAMLSMAANGAAPSLGALISCAPTVPPEEDEETEEKPTSSA